MALNNYIYIFHGTDMDPKCSRVEIKNSSFHFKAVGVAHLDEAVEVAQQAVKDGAQAIELCGAFGEKGKKMISESINACVPVGYIIF